MSENVQPMSANVQEPPRRYICCVPTEAKEGTVTLGSVYNGVVKRLKARGWKRLKKETQRPGSADLILGGPCGQGVPWKALRVHRSAGTPPLTSFYRSFEQICRKGLLARTLRWNGGPHATPAWFPTSYIIAPGREEAAAERALLRAAHAERGGDGGCGVEGAFARRWRRSRASSSRALARCRERFRATPSPRRGPR
jgi:hypothetical protein